MIWSKLLKINNLEIMQNPHSQGEGAKLPSLLGGTFAVLHNPLWGAILCLLLSASLTFAQTTLSPTQRMAVANEFYEAGQFEQAINLYETLRHDGFSHSSLYYNLGNAYYKQGNLGRAILNYRRAQLLAPRDRDIATNLAIARSRMVDKWGESPETVTMILATLTQKWLTMKETGLVALGLWLFYCIAFSVTLLWARLTGAARVGMWLGVAGLVLLALSMSSRLYLDWRYPQAVVVAESIEVTNGPGASDRYPKQFRLYAGVEARLLEQRGSWVHLMFPNNLEGWVSAQAVAWLHEP